MPESRGERDGSPELPRELVDWPARLERERPLIERLVGEAPLRRGLDLGCGAGHHARLLAELGCEVVAIDASEAALDEAEAGPASERVQFVLNDVGAVERTVRGHFGLALCLGNTLPHLLSPESVSRMLVGLKRRLRPGASCLFQLVNYDRVFAGERTLPLEILRLDGVEHLLVRLLEPREDGIVLHTSTLLRHTPGAEPVMEVVDVRRLQLRGWRLEELAAMLDVARLPVRETFGGMEGEGYDRSTSSELVLVAG